MYDWVAATNWHRRQGFGCFLPKGQYSANTISTNDEMPCKCSNLLRYKAKFVYLLITECDAPRVPHPDYTDASEA